MVTLDEEASIASPPDAVWPLLRDPAVVAGCIPGATLEADAGGTWRGAIRVKFGPTVAVFKGEADVAFDDAARRVTIEGRGIDGRGASRALASSVVTVEGGDTTTLKVRGEFSVTGPLESFVNAGGVHVARALLADFSANMASVLARRGGAANDTPAETVSGEAVTPPPVAVAGEPASPPALGGASLLWRALAAWARGLFRKGR